MNMEDMELDNSGRISKDDDMMSERGDCSNVNNASYGQRDTGVQGHTHREGRSVITDGRMKSKVQTSLQEKFDEIQHEPTPKPGEKWNESNVESREGDSYGGALWDIFRREDASKVQDYVKNYWTEFKHFEGQPLKDAHTNITFVGPQLFHPIHDQTIYLTENHKRRLKEEYGVEAWTFEQHIGEAVLIPAGCPHQVRNLKSCIKVALDFVSPENIQECVRLTEEFRLLPNYHGAKGDKLEVIKLAVHVLNLVLRQLSRAQGRNDEGNLLPPR